MSNPLVDTAVIIGIESNFRDGASDPWRKKLSGNFADLFIYSDTFRFGLPLANPNYSELDDNIVPTLIQTLKHRDSNIIIPAKFSTADILVLNEEYLSNAFDRFLVWAHLNKKTLQRFAALHSETWVEELRYIHFAKWYFFSLEFLRINYDLKDISEELGLRNEQMIYAFDVVLSYSIYGHMTGEKEYYLNHPLRSIFSMPTQHESIIKHQNIPLSFRNLFESFIEKLTLEEYTVLLHELRGQVRELGINQVAPGDFDREIVRELASRVKLPPKLKSIAKVATVGGGIISALATIPVLGIGAGLLGSAISLSCALWSGRLPCTANRIKWLRWALEWDLEKQADKRS